MTLKSFTASSAKPESASAPGAILAPAVTSMASSSNSFARPLEEPHLDDIVGAAEEARGSGIATITTSSRVLTGSKPTCRRRPHHRRALWEQVGRGLQPAHIIRCARGSWTSGGTVDAAVSATRRRRLVATLPRCRAAPRHCDGDHVAARRATPHPLLPQSSSKAFFVLYHCEQRGESRRQHRKKACSRSHERMKMPRCASRPTRTCHRALLDGAVRAGDDALVGRGARQSQRVPSQRDDLAPTAAPPHKHTAADHAVRRRRARYSRASWMKSTMIAKPAGSWVAPWIATARREKNETRGGARRVRRRRAREADR